MTGPDERQDPMEDPDYRRMVELARNVPPIDWGDVPQTEAERPASPSLRAVGEDERAPLPQRLTDLGPYLDGTYEPEQPTVGASREDGARYLYPRRWHTVIGPTTAGKSWWALVHAAVVLMAGGYVLYCHFEETTPVGTIARLRRLGVPDEVILERFWWVDTGHRWVSGEFEILMGQLAAHPELVIHDGINAACGLQAWPVKEPESVGLYRRMFVIPATQAGAAVLSLGHPVKDPNRANEIHGYGASGWLDDVDGVGFRLLPGRDRIRRGRLGFAQLYAVKDRYGEVSIHGEPNRDGWYDLGSMRVDDTGEEQTTVSFTVPHVPEPEEAQATPERPRDRRAETGQLIVQVLTEHGGSYAGYNALRDKTKATSDRSIGNDLFKDALLRLEFEGWVERVKEGRTETIRLTEMGRLETASDTPETHDPGANNGPDQSVIPLS